MFSTIGEERFDIGFPFGCFGLNEGQKLFAHLGGGEEVACGRADFNWILDTRPAPHDSSLITAARATPNLRGWAKLLGAPGP